MLTLFIMFIGGWAKTISDSVQDTHTDLVIEKERSKSEDKKAIATANRMHDLHNGLHDAERKRFALELRIQKLETLRGN